MAGKSAAADRFRGERIAINRDLEFPAKYFQAANVVAMFVGEEHTIELARCDPALFQPEHELPGAQPAIDQEAAMIGRDQGGVPGAAAAEHGQTEHARLVTDAHRIHKQELPKA